MSGVKEKVKGKSTTIPTIGPRPGRIPTTTPTNDPNNREARLARENAAENPSIMCSNMNHSAKNSSPGVRETRHLKTA